MAASDTNARERVRVLNDQLRQHRIGGTVVVTPGVAALAPDAPRVSAPSMMTTTPTASTTSGQFGCKATWYSSKSSTTPGA